jgi:hypothetical protein
MQLQEKTAPSLTPPKKACANMLPMLPISLAPEPIGRESALGSSGRIVVVTATVGEDAPEVDQWRVIAFRTAPYNRPGSAAEEKAEEGAGYQGVYISVAHSCLPYDGAATIGRVSVDPFAGLGNIVNPQVAPDRRSDAACALAALTESIDCPPPEVVSVGRAVAKFLIVNDLVSRQTNTAQEALEDVHFLFLRTGLGDLAISLAMARSLSFSLVVKVDMLFSTRFEHGVSDRVGVFRDGVVVVVMFGIARHSIEYGDGAECLRCEVIGATCHWTWR